VVCSSRQCVVLLHEFITHPALYLAAKITSVIDELTNSTGFLTDAQLRLSEFNNTDASTIRKDILQSAYDKISRGAEGVKNAISQLHLLLFG
jgi:hypothetical protein